MKYLVILMSLVGFKAFAQFDPPPPSTGSDFPPIQCGEGETLTQFSLAPVPEFDQDQATELLAGQVPSSVPLNILMASAQNRVRLDTCVSMEGRVQVRRVLRMSEGHIEDLAQNQGVTWQTRGVEEAVFEQDYTSLHMEIHPRDFLTSIVRGFSGSQPFIGVYTTYAMGDRPADAFGGPVIVGRLELGDSFQNVVCRGGQEQRESVVSYADLTLTMTLCLFQGGGQTVGYTLATLQVLDNSPHLPATARGKPVDIDVKEAVAQGTLLYGYGHHNDSDRFALVMPTTGVKYELWQTGFGYFSFRLTYPASSEAVTGSGEGMILLGGAHTLLSGSSSVVN